MICMNEQATDKQSNIQDGWEEAYLQHNDISLWQENAIPFLPEVINLIHQREYKTLIDLGCGDGRNLVPLANAGLICTGVDLSKTALACSHKRLQKFGAHAFLMEGDVTNLNFADQSVEVVTCFDVFGQLPEPEKVIAEIRRILIPGGLFAMNAFTPNDSEFGLGDKIGERVFCYKNTLFRFFEKSELIDLFNEWEVLQIKKESWIDPPHGEFRPYEHKHENWILLASSPK
jgi:ubiquinone/menaquinone biosynthesis C-methylase UbiE